MSSALLGASADVSLIIDHVHASQSAVPTVVPEPSSLAMAGAGALAFLGTAFLRRRTA